MRRIDASQQTATNINKVTGPAGSIPRRPYCSPQCYGAGKLDRAHLCNCEGCGQDAHGKKKKYAFDNGYLKDSPIPPRKPPVGQMKLGLTWEQWTAQIDRVVSHQQFRGLLP